jgi:hypothetical protein
MVSPPRSVLNSTSPRAPHRCGQTRTDRGWSTPVLDGRPTHKHPALVISFPDVWGSPNRRFDPPCRTRSRRRVQGALWGGAVQENQPRLPQPFLHCRRRGVRAGPRRGEGRLDEHPAPLSFYLYSADVEPTGASQGRSATRRRRSSSSAILSTSAASDAALSRQTSPFHHQVRASAQSRSRSAVARSRLRRFVSALNIAEQSSEQNRRGAASGAHWHLGAAFVTSHGCSTSELLSGRAVSARG